MRMDEILALPMRVQSKILQLIVLIGKFGIVKFVWYLSMYFLSIFIGF